MEQNEEAYIFTFFGLKISTSIYTLAIWLSAVLIGIVIGIINPKSLYVIHSEKIF